MRVRASLLYAALAVMDEKAPVVVFEVEAGQDSRLRDALPGVDCRFIEQVLSDQTVDQVGEASVVSVFIRSRRVDVSPSTPPRPLGLTQ